MKFDNRFAGLLLLSWVLVTAAGCGDTKRACSAATCTGCCTADGTCDFGSSNSSCGTGGAKCVACVGLQTCSLGTCLIGFNTGGGLAATGGGTTATGGGAATGGGTTATGGGTTATGGGSSGTGGGTAATGGGTAGSDGGFSWDGGHTVDAIRGAKYCTERVTVENAIVTGIDTITPKTTGNRVAFWVADRADQRHGIYVFKSETDTPATYLPNVGDVVTIEGYLQRYDSTWDRFGYRLNLTNGCAGVGTLVITTVGSGTVTPILMTAGFGNSNGGTTRPGAEFGSALVTIPGPLTLSLSGATPTALERINSTGGLQGYNGFQVNTGLLVDNFYTFDQGDGGRCDYRKTVEANGVTVTFPNGITGIWDTYTHAPCLGVTNCGSARDAGYVPGTNNSYTYTIYPLDCSQLSQ